MQTGAALLANNCQYCRVLHVASVCTPCCMLLRVVGSCCAKLETGQTFSYVQTDATLLAYNSFARSFIRPRCRRRGWILRSLIRISLTHLCYTSLLRYHNLSSFSTSENKAAFSVLDDNVTQIYQLFNFQLNLLLALLLQGPFFGK